MLPSEVYVPLNDLERQLFTRMVPESHPLQRLDRLIDFERFRPTLAKFYSPRVGRRAAAWNRPRSRRPFDKGPELTYLWAVSLRSLASFCHSGLAMLPSASEVRTLPDITLNASDQRRHTRYVGIDAGTLRLAIRPEFRGRTGVLVDVSASGMGFLLAEPIEVGATLVFELRLPGGETTITRIARVRHNRPHPVPDDPPWRKRHPGVGRLFRRMFGIPDQPPRAEAWFVGCEFDQPLTAEELKFLLDPVV